MHHMVYTIFAFHTPFETKFFFVFTPQKTVHGKLKNGPSPNNNIKKKKKNAFLSLISGLRRR